MKHFTVRGRKYRRSLAARFLKRDLARQGAIKPNQKIWIGYRPEVNVLDLYNNGIGHTMRVTIVPHGIF